MNGCEKEFIKRITVCVLLVLLCAFAVYFIIGTRNVHDNGNGVGKVRNELRSIETTQREEKRTIERTERAITNSTNAVRNGEQTNKDITEIERKDAELITECQQILARVRERTTTED